MRLLQFLNTSIITLAKPLYKMSLIKKSSFQYLKHFITMVFILTIFKNIQCIGQQYTPVGMDYELRRPITYLYNRLAYKYDFNPYTSHLIDTQSHCSSRTGPFCGFINNRELMETRMTLNAADKRIHDMLIGSASSNKQAAFQIEKGLMDAFLISGQQSKKFDESVKKFVDKDFYAEVPTHQLLKKDKIHHQKNLRNKDSHLFQIETNNYFQNQVYQQ